MREKERGCTLGLAGGQGWSGHLWAPAYSSELGWGRTTALPKGPQAARHECMREGGAPSPPTPESVLNVEAFRVPNLPGSHTLCPFSLAQVSSNTFLLPPPTPFRFLLS